MTDREHAANVQRSADFFWQAGLERLLFQLREKYIEQGQVGGQVQLQETTAQERREVASFLGKPPYRNTTIRVKLKDIDSALRQSGFRCTLPELLTAFFSNAPLITRPQQRAAHSFHQEQFYAALQALIDEQEADSQGQRWLLDGQHGREWLFARYKNATAEEQERQIGTIRYVASLLNQLPLAATPERLALYAQRTSGDPHSLDPGRPAGRLFLQALSDLAGGSSVLSMQGRIQELQLYQDVGLLVDTISSHVATFHLAAAMNTNGLPDSLPTIAGARILLLPLCQLLQWQSASAATEDIYVIENPQVFEEVVANLQDNANEHTTPLPTLICTSGWPSVAALTLLNLLLSSNSAHHLHYSGDFDLKGLQIAAYLLERYAERCSPWHIDTTGYQTALQADGIPARPGELQQLNTLPLIFMPLIETMQAQGKWAYQEGIAQLLINDLLAS